MDAYEYENTLDRLNPEYCPNLDRIVVCLDMDEFRVQVEGLEDEQVATWMEENSPIVVATKSSKRLLSVNYAARELGVKPANEEKRTLDDLIYEYEYQGLKVHYPKMRYGREDMFTPEKYMNEVYKALENYRQKLANPNSITIKWAKMEEIYVDVTALVLQRYGAWGQPPVESRVRALCDAVKKYPNYYGDPRIILEGKHGPLYGSVLESKILDWDDRVDVEKRLIHGGVIASAIVNAIKKDSGMQASAGVSHTKLLARLACRMNKPEGITILSFPGFARLSSEIKIGRISGYGSLGEKLAERCYYRYGMRLEFLADTQNLDRDAIEDLQDVFLEVFPRIRRSTAQQRAEKFLYSCHGNDSQIVQCSPFFKKAMESSARIPRDATCGQAKHILRCLCQDFDRRIWFYKENRNLIPQDVSFIVVTNTDESLPKEIFERNLCGWRYMFAGILNHLQDFDLCLEDLKHIKITARYRQQPRNEISDDEY